jgi:2-polyprenyl-3-methyl-5-hydroxy-6-metoxy-1,4-benzoquinol methylase
MTIQCALCSGHQTVLQEEVEVTRLNTAYRKLTGIRNPLKTEKLNYLKCLDCGLLFFDPLQAGDESLYERLQRFDWYYMEDKLEYDIARKFLPIGGKVLEVGAGAAAFSRVVGQGRYTGLEFNDLAIERAGRHGIALIKQSVEEHARSGNKYDAVVSFQVLEHVAAPASFIRGCVECLNSGGTLIVAVPAHDGFAGRALNNILNMPPHHVTHWPERTLRHLAPLFGLEVLAIEFEPVAVHHKPWARKTNWEAGLRIFLGMRQRLLDYSLAATLVSKLSSLMARILPCKVERLIGHSVVAVYRKAE